MEGLNHTVLWIGVTPDEIGHLQRVVLCMEGLDMRTHWREPNANEHISAVVPVDRMSHAGCGELAASIIDNEYNIHVTVETVYDESRVHGRHNRLQTKACVVIYCTACCVKVAILDRDRWQC